MKSLFRFTLLAAFMISVTACTKETSSETGGSASTKGDFYATIDGNQWNADSVQLILVSSDGVSITGISKTGAQVSMVLPDFKIGTYTLGAQSLSYALYGNLITDATSVFVSNVGTAGGTVTITGIDTVNHLASGTFQLILVNPADNTTKTITKGVFDYITYTGGSGGIVIPPPGGLADTLNAVIDGVKFVSASVVHSTSNGQLLLAGFSSSGIQDIGLLMPPGVAPGTYPLDFATGIYIGIYNPTPAITLVSQSSGSVTIISNDTGAKRIKGSFNFTASPTGSGTPAVITDGYFSISY